MGNFTAFYQLKIIGLEETAVCLIYYLGGSSLLCLQVY